MKARIKFKNKVFEIVDLERVSGFGKFKGLMLRPKGTNALLFEFEKPVKNAIHSLFCPNFLAIWMNEGRIVDYRMVDSLKFSIKPEHEFTKLLEIPLNDKYANIISEFSQGNSRKMP